MAELRLSRLERALLDPVRKHPADTIGVHREVLLAFEGRRTGVRTLPDHAGQRHVVLVGRARRLCRRRAQTGVVRNQHASLLELVVTSRPLEEERHKIPRRLTSRAFGGSAPSDETEGGRGRPLDQLEQRDLACELATAAITKLAVFQDDGRNLLSDRVGNGEDPRGS